MTLTQVTKAGLDALALDHVFTIGASGSSAYTFQGEGLNGTVNNPTLYLTRGKTYRFENGSGGHPIRIQSTSGASGTAYNTGVTNNAGSGTVIVEVQHDAPDVLYYQCTSHPAMNGTLYITGALADGGVTTAKLADDAVDADKLANSINTAIAANTAKTSNATHTGDVTGSTSLTIAADAVTNAKIADGAVDSEHLAVGCINNSSFISGQVINTGAISDEAVTLAKLPHGDASSDGKFLRANNGADPSFETVSIPAGTTINNNADNRIITGSGTANTLNGEANLTMGNNLQFNTTANGNAVILKSTGNYYNKLSFDSGNTSAGGELAYVDFSWDGDKVADIQALAGSDTTNKDDGHLVFRTSPQQGNIGERLRITSGGQLNIGGDYTQTSYNLSVTNTGGNLFRLKTANEGDYDLRFMIQNSESNIWHYGTDDLTFGARYDRKVSLIQNGSKRLTINGDLIGINNTSPAKNLHVTSSGVATLRIETTDSRGQAWDLLSTNGAGSNTGTLSFRDESGSAYLEFGANGGSPELTVRNGCLLYTSPSPRDRTRSRMPSSA